MAYRAVGVGGFDVQLQAHQAAIGQLGHQAFVRQQLAGDERLAEGERHVGLGAAGVLETDVGQDRPCLHLRWCGRDRVERGKDDRGSRFGAVAAADGCQRYAAVGTARTCGAAAAACGERDRAQGTAYISRDFACCVAASQEGISHGAAMGTIRILNPWSCIGFHDLGT
jgi:hypothetical protein